MRDLKFRVWDKITKQLIYLTKVNFVNYEVDYKNTGFELAFDGIGKESKKKQWLRKPKDYIIQQFTSLKIHNIEIYEGDILNTISNRYLVEYKEAKFIGRGLFYTKPIYDLCDLENSILMGNMFESPGLLKL